MEASVFVSSSVESVRSLPLGVGHAQRERAAGRGGRRRKARFRRWKREMDGDGRTSYCGGGKGARLRWDVGTPSRSRSKTRGLSRRAAYAAFVAFVLRPGVALADPTAAERAAAESLFHDGRQLLEAGQVATACAKFAESQRLAPALGSLLNLAACHELEGKTASAWVEFSEAATLAERAGARERAAYATQRRDALERELARVTVSVSAWHDGMRVTIDGHEIRPGAFGTAIPVDPGAHRIQASAPGRRTWEQALVVGRGASTLAIQVPELEAIPSPTGPASEPKPPPAPPPTSPRALGSPPSGRTDGGTGSTTHLPLLIATGTMAAAGIGIGTVYGLRTFSEKREADRECPSRSCPSRTAVEANERAYDAALVSTVAFGLGTASAAVFTYLLVTELGAPKAARLMVAPAVAQGRAHVVAATSF